MHSWVVSLKKWAVLKTLFFISVLTVFFGIWLPDQISIANWFQASGFGLIFASFLLWLTSLPWEKLTRERIAAFAGRHALVAGLALVITVSAFLTSPPRFRILADETNLLGMASAMYDEHSFYNPTQRTHFYLGMMNTIAKEWDKRPLFFPFMIYLTHSFLGYREINGFVVNFISSVALLFAFYLLLNRFFTRFLSLLGMILLSAFPLLVLWMTSSSFEVPNMLFGVLAFLAFERLTRSNSARHAEILCLTLVLLAQIRYESVLFLIVLMPVGALFIKREEFAALSWRMVAVPVLLLPVVWQRLITFNQGVFQMTDGKPPFSLEWLMPNLGHAWRFFTAYRGAYGMIPLVFLGAIAGVIAGLWYLGSRRHESPLRAWLIPGSALAIVTLHAAILFLYFWGNLTLQYAMRLGLIFVPFLVAACIFLLDRLSDGGRRARVWLAVGICALPIWYWSAAGPNEAVREILLFREFTTVRGFLENRYPRKDVLLISDLSNIYVPLRWSSVGNSYANGMADGLLLNLKNGLFQDIVAIQRIKYSTGLPSPETSLDPKFDLEPLFEAQYSSEEMLRLSRVRKKEKDPIHSTKGGS